MTGRINDNQLKTWERRDGGAMDRSPRCPRGGDGNATVTERSVPVRDAESPLFDPQVPSQLIRRERERLDSPASAGAMGVASPSNRILWSFVPYGRLDPLLATKRPVPPRLVPDGIPGELKDRR